MKITLRKQDICEVEADAIVNAAGTSLIMGGGVAGALKRAGGQEIERDAVAQGPIPLGEAVVTGAYRLKAKYVIHAASMPDHGTRNATGESIRNCVRNALKRADRLNCRTVAMPCLGCGIAGFPIAMGARIIIDEIKTCSVMNIEEVLLVVHSGRDFRITRKILTG